jgi:dihydrodipicolinate synthase/N-acetylneuraminate lyase
MADLAPGAAMKKLLSRLGSLGFSMVAGALAGGLFKQLWKLIAREEEPPQAADPQRSWKEVLPAAALQGALFATVKAAVQRGALQAGRKLTRSSADGGTSRRRHHG